MKKRIECTLVICCVTVFALLMTVFPNQSRNGALTGLMLCGRIIIPALYPFTFCALMIMRSGLQGLMRPINGFTKRAFNLDSICFCVFLLSLIGGYPVGARLTAELADSGKTDRKTAQTLICCCVNAGPAFVVSAVGAGILGSRVLGTVLLLSHLLSSFVLLILFRRKFSFSAQRGFREELQPFSERFVTCAADAASSLINICAFVILFSTVNGYLLQSDTLKYPAMIVEVTNGVTLTRNIYIISFLLGFGGLSVWCQITAVTRNCGLNFPLFIFSRLLHGGISAMLTWMIVHISGITAETLSSNTAFTQKSFVSSAAVAAALFVMVLLMIISLFGKNQGRNFGNDMV